MADAFTRAYEGIDLDVTLVDSKNLSSVDVREYNDLGVLLRWINEKLQHEDMNFISASNEPVREVAKRMGTNHFLFCAMLAHKETKQEQSIILFDALIIYNFFELLTICIDAETDQFDLISLQSVNLKTNENVVGAYVYDILCQISSKPK